jgi:hypothetical protein
MGLLTKTRPTGSHSRRSTPGVSFPFLSLESQWKRETGNGAYRRETPKTAELARLRSYAHGMACAGLRVSVMKYLMRSALNVSRYLQTPRPPQFPIPISISKAPD